MRRFLSNFNLLLLSSLLSLSFLVIVFESYLRFFDLHWINVPSVHFDADTEFFNRANFESIFTFKGKTTHQKINSHGFRSPEISTEKSDQKKRIAFIGDSFTYGFNVNDGEEYPAQTIRKLSQAHPLEYLNAGVENIGIGHEIAIFRKYVKKFNPDIIVHTFCTNNDFEDIYLGPLRREGESLTVNKPKHLFAYQIQDFLYSNGFTLSILKHSHSVSFIRDLLSRRINRVRRQILNETMPQSDENVVLDAFFFIQELKKEAGDAKFYFVVAPGRFFYKDTTTNRRLDWLLAKLREAGILYLDLRPVFIKIYGQNQKTYDELWQEPDQHWSRRANEIAGDRVYQFLKNKI